MKIERTKNATRNILFGSILKIYQIAIPFLMRTAMIYFLGIEYLGLNSLFTSILQVLNLAELGVGSAMIFSMYKPIVEDDDVTICALMNLYRTYYRIIGLVILIAGLFLVPFLPSLIKSDVPPDIDINVLYLINLFATVLTYWLFAYKNCILQAHQRNDVGNKIIIVVDTIKYILQIAVLMIFHNYYYFVIAILFTQIIANIATAYYSDKLYPQYKPFGNISKNERQQINKRIRDLFTTKIGSVIINSADTIVISSFLGLTMLAIYQNYFYIITAVLGLLSIIFASCTAGIGNSLIVESKEKNYNDLKKLTFIIAWLTGWCTVCLLCLLQPFMEIWVGKDLMLGFFAVICLCSYFYIFEITCLLNLFKDAAGIWHEDRFRPLLTGIFNLGLNLLSINYIGIYGVILSTVISLVLMGVPWLLYNIFTVLFKRSAKYYILKLIKYLIITVIASLITFYVCTFFINFDGWAELIVKGIICCFLPNLIFFVCLRGETEFGQSIILVDKVTKYKFNLEKRLLKHK